MKIEDQVCTLEQAKKLIGLGVVSNNTQFAFVLRLEEMRLCNVLEYNRWAAQYNEPFVKETTNYPAFTVAELGVMLPTGYDTMRLTEGENNELWKPYDDSDNDILGSYTYFNTEAKARAAMVIYLLENKIITVEEVNQRLK